MSEPRTYLNQFEGGYVPPEVAALIGRKLVDDSWGNDACPKFTIIGTGITLWCDHENPDDREVGFIKRFSFRTGDGDETTTLYQTEGVKDAVSYAEDAFDEAAFKKPVVE